ncbi:DUF6946 family protein [Rhizobium giardinii]|uniref:DUF6946 family protein n=1 Tax=Rhizobium giardinii TaxID=56731 RepID=UPI003B839CF7
MCDVLGLAETRPAHIRYQLLHRTASAVIKAKRFKTDEAAMIVHSFSATRMWFDDFTAFTRLFDQDIAPDRGVRLSLNSGVRLRLGWATGDAAFLETGHPLNGGLDRPSPRRSLTGG